jgi:hypothetical protein
MSILRSERSECCCGQQSHTQAYLQHALAPAAEHAHRDDRLARLVLLLLGHLLVLVLVLLVLLLVDVHLAELEQTRVLGLEVLEELGVLLLQLRHSLRHRLLVEVRLLLVPLLLAVLLLVLLTQLLEIAPLLNGHVQPPGAKQLVHRLGHAPRLAALGPALKVWALVLVVVVLIGQLVLGVGRAALQPPLLLLALELLLALRGRAALADRLLELAGGHELFELLRRARHGGGSGCGVGVVAGRRSRNS